MQHTACFLSSDDPCGDATTMNGTSHTQSPFANKTNAVAPSQSGGSMRRRYSCSGIRFVHLVRTPVILCLRSSRMGALSKGLRVLRVREHGARHLRSNILKLSRGPSGMAWSGATLAPHHAPTSGPHRGHRPRAFHSNQRHVSMHRACVHLHVKFDRLPPVALSSSEACLSGVDRWCAGSCWLCEADFEGLVRSPGVPT